MRTRSTAVALALLAGVTLYGNRFDRSAAPAAPAPPDNPRANSLKCDLTGYKGAPGLTAALVGDVLTLTWDGAQNQQVRLRLANNSGTPTIQDLAVRRKGGTWGTLASHVTPEFRVVSGRRRMDTEAQEGLRENGITEITPEVFEKYQWDPFWDAPLNIPGTADMGRTLGLPRSPEEMHRGTDRKSTRLNSSHGYISYAVFCLKKKKTKPQHQT